MDSQNTFTLRSTSFQMGTIGAEIGRAVSWRANPVYGNPDTCILRALTYIEQAQHSLNITTGKRRELARLKEVLIDWYYGDNTYQTKTVDLDRYFLPFSLAANQK